MLLGIFQIFEDVKLFKKSSDADFKRLDDNLRSGSNININEARTHLLSDGWVLNGPKT